MSTINIASNVDPVVVLSVMAAMIKSARKTFKQFGEVKLVAGYSEMEITAGGKVILVAANNILENEWSIHGDERLKNTVVNLILKNKREAESMTTSSAVL
jgi:hypothetical protein